MVEYRHNEDWNTFLIKDMNEHRIKEEIEDYARRNHLGDIEVVDTQITTRLPYDGASYNKYDMFVFYVKLKPKPPVEPEPQKSKVEVKD